MEKSVLDIICASLDSFFESEKKSGIPAVSGTIGKHKSAILII